MKKTMFYAAGPTIFNNAKALRNNPTDAERILWMHLRTRPRGYKFRRQHPASNYILDFYCYALSLAIEVDGTIHNLPEVAELDIERQRFLEASGIYVIRFSNQQVKLHINEVINQIDAAIHQCIQKK